MGLNSRVSLRDRSKAIDEVPPGWQVSLGTVTPSQPEHNPLRDFLWARRPEATQSHGLSFASVMAAVADSKPGLCLAIFLSILAIAYGISLFIS
jgi:hypothetical protein